MNALFQLAGSPPRVRRFAGSPAKSTPIRFAGSPPRNANSVGGVGDFSITCVTQPSCWRTQLDASLDPHTSHAHRVSPRERIQGD